MDLLASNDAKEQMKKIKKMNSSILTALPSIQDVNSEIISKIGVLYGASGDTTKQ